MKAASIAAIGLVAIFLVGLAMVSEQGPGAKLTTTRVGGIEGASKPTFSISGGLSSLAVTAGTSASSQITITLNATTNFRFFINDEGYNSSSSDLPTGIALNATMAGNSYSIERVTAIHGDLANSANPSIQVTAGTSIVKFSVSVSNSVPAGTYQIPIIIVSFVKNGATTGEGLAYTIGITVSTR